MTRERLPDRRPQVTEMIAWGGQRWTLSAGFDDAGRVREIFLSGPKVGSDAEALAHDGAIALSLLLQGGMGAEQLAEHLGRQGIDHRAAAASLLGLAAHRAAEIEAAEGADMRELAMAARGQRG